MTAEIRATVHGPQNRLSYPRLVSLLRHVFTTVEIPNVFPTEDGENRAWTRDYSQPPLQPISGDPCQYLYYSRRWLNIDRCFTHIKVGMCIYIYIYVYIYIYMCRCICMCTYARVCIYIYIYIFKRKHILLEARTNFRGESQSHDPEVE